MKSFNRKLLAFCSVAALLFIAVMSGGCGGSPSTPSSSPDPIIDVDSTLSGVWRIDTSANNYVSADINGSEVNLAIKDFVLRFQSVDIESSSGELYFDTVAIFSSDRVLIPIAFDEVKAATKNLADNVFSMEAYGNNYMFEISGTESDPVLTLLANVNLFGDHRAFVAIDFKKFSTASSKTNEQMNAIINGTWQTPIPLNGMVNGGFVFVSDDMPEPEFEDDLPEPPERPSDMPLIEGMREIDTAFANVTFENTNTAANSTVITTQIAVGTLTTSGDFTGPVNPVMNVDYSGAKITALYDNMYKIEISSDNKSYFLVDSDGTHAYFINWIIIPTSDTTFTETRTVLALEKKPDMSQSSFDLTQQIGTVWHSLNLAVGEIRDSTSTRPAEIRFNELSLLFPSESADVANKTFGTVILGEYYELEPAGTASEAKLLSLDITVKNIERIGYNSWYADDGGDSSFIITVLNNNYALITANLIRNGKEISIIALMSQLGDIENIFFAGAWTCWSSDADISITQGTATYNTTLLNFGVNITSVDFDSGSASLSAVVVLSSDLFLIPVVFDNIAVSVDEGAESGEFTLTSPRVSLTVTAYPGDPNKLDINGAFTQSDVGITVSIDAAASRVIPGQTSQELDFDSIMNQSTWQSIPFDNRSGGFAIIGISSYKMMYPGVNNKTFANIVFDGDKTSGTISGFGTMGLTSLDFGTGNFVDNGLTLPVTIIKESVDVSQVFGNFYRFEFISGDADIKGVFILESESTAYMIMFATNGANADVITNLYSVFYLHKVTESTEIDLTGFDNTSWDVTQAGGLTLLPDGNILQITNASPDIYQVRLKDFTVKFTDADETAKTVGFTVTASADINTSGNITNHQVAIPEKTVSIEKLGAYTWYGISGNSEFLVTMSAAYQNRAALAGNLNFTSPNNADYNIIASILLDLELKQ
ncbi:MAG: hypothetical protein IJT21_09870 [Synergistaceae bacterium]|nr:hypothetical protein [Synergistaceae bacterium]